MMGRKAGDIGTLNALLRGELAAVETYRQALPKFAEDGQAAAIRRLQEGHAEAADALRRHIHGLGGEPAKGAGAWGVFAKVVAGAAKLLGPAVTLKALKEGEEQGVFEYENALKGHELAADSKALIETRLLPQTKAHVPVLDHLLTGA